MKTDIQQRMEEAESKYPMKGYVTWFANVFPDRNIAIMAAILVVVGIFMTAFNVAREHRFAVTINIVIIVVSLVTMLLIAKHKQKCVFKKRAEYLGISLQEYLELLNTMN